MFKLPARIRPTIKSGHVKFFRNRLLTLTAEDIANYIEALDQEANSIRSNNFRLAWHMRGGITYDQVMQLGQNERQMISELIKENIETTKKTNLPWF